MLVVHSPCTTCGCLTRMKSSPSKIASLYDPFSGCMAWPGVMVWPHMRICQGTSPAPQALRQEGYISFEGGNKNRRAKASNSINLAGEVLGALHESRGATYHGEAALDRLIHQQLDHIASVAAEVAERWGRVRSRCNSVPRTSDLVRRRASMRAIPSCAATHRRAPPRCSTRRRRTACRRL